HIKNFSLCSATSRETQPTGRSRRFVASQFENSKTEENIRIFASVRSTDQIIEILPTNQKKRILLRKTSLPTAIYDRPITSAVGNLKAINQKWLELTKQLLDDKHKKEVQIYS
ncbi:hypothetical protein LOAG_13650, partial [Loa loa]